MLLMLLLNRHLGLCQYSRCSVKSVDVCSCLLQGKLAYYGYVMWDDCRWGLYWLLLILKSAVGKHTH